MCIFCTIVADSVGEYSFDVMSRDGMVSQIGSEVHMKVSHEEVNVSYTVKGLVYQCS
jgi:hypothetical protein